LSDPELDVLATLSDTLRPHVADDWWALSTAVSALLQSPQFLFRVELGEPHPARPGMRRYSDWEMASRLSFLLWNTGPDEALLDAAAAGELTTDEGLRAQFERLAASPRAQDAVASFFAEYLNLQRLDGLAKDRGRFPLMSDTLGASMAAEVEAIVARVVFEEEADLRTLLTTRQTFLDGPLAALYQLPAVEQPTWTQHPPEGPRGGLLTTAAFLALNAHNTVTSPTYRGKFIQNKLLCFDVPPPPPGVSTTLDEPVDGPQTMRERLARHNADPQCNGCHQFMDPLGLAFENFDAIGMWRTTEHGLPIDASGHLSGVDFEGGRALGQLLAQRSEFAACVTRQFYRHALGHLEARTEEPAIVDLIEAFGAVEYRFLPLVEALVASEAFRLVGEVE
jgi:hypothetical protein